MADYVVRSWKNSCGVLLSITDTERFKKLLYFYKEDQVWELLQIKVSKHINTWKCDLNEELLAVHYSWRESLKIFWFKPEWEEQNPDVNFDLTAMQTANKNNKQGLKKRTNINTFKVKHCSFENKEILHVR